MAGKKISQLTALGSTYAATDLFEISKDMGGGTYASRKITGAELTSSIGAGTVTSVDVSGGTTGLTTSGGPITGTGTITLAGTLAIANGGTGASTPQAAIDALTSVSGAATGEVLTKDASGNATWAAAAGGATDLDGLTDAEIGGGAGSYYNIFLSNGSSAGGAPQHGTIGVATEGNIAIGGDALKTLSDGDYNIAIGYNASPATTTGSGNIAIGKLALYVNNSGGNVAIGNDAGKAGNTYGGSVYIGQSAGDSDTVGQNTYVGYQAGNSSTGGWQNVALGYQADVSAGAVHRSIAIGMQQTTSQSDTLSLGGLSKTLLHGEYGTTGNTKLGINLGNTWQTPTATLHVKGGGLAFTDVPLLITDSNDIQLMKLNAQGRNVLIGHKAGDAINAGGMNNICMGYKAGETLVSGQHNVLMGQQVKCKNTSSDNFFVGNQAGSTTCGSGNIAFGYISQWKNNGGLHNISLGYESALDLTSGSYNIFLGWKTGGVVTTGSNNIVIGKDLDVSGAGVSDELNIGGQIIGNMDSAGDRYTKFVGQVYTETATVSGTGVTIDWFDSNVKRITLSGTTTFNNPQHLKDGATYVLIIHQPAGANHTASFGTAFKWEGGTAPTLTATNGATDILTFVSDGTNLYGVAAQNFS